MRSLSAAEGRDGARRSATERVIINQFSDPLLMITENGTAHSAFGVADAHPAVMRNPICLVARESAWARS